jgi:hypothetical protein
VRCRLTLGSVDGRDPLGPTVGFQPSNIVLNFQSPLYHKSQSISQPLTFYDVGGGPKIRGIWKNYIAEAHGFVYIVPESKDITVQDSMHPLFELFQNEETRQHVLRKPWLILINRTFDQTDMSERVLNLLKEQLSQHGPNIRSISELANDDSITKWASMMIVHEAQLRGQFPITAPSIKKSNKLRRNNKVSPTKPTDTSTITFLDPRLLQSLNWLLHCIRESSIELDQRVLDAIKKLKEQYRREKEEKERQIQQQTAPKVKETKTMEGPLFNTGPI